MDFPGEALDSILANKMQDFLNFIQHNCILIFDTEQVYKKLQITNFKKKEVTAKPKSQSCPNPRKKLVFPIP